MTCRLLALLFAFCAFSLTGQHAASAPALDLRVQAYVNELAILQQALIEGDRQAVTQYRERVGSVGQRIMALPDTVFDQPASIDAVVKYLLMGGQPRVGRRVLKILKRADRPMGLLFAATAFASGRPSLAKKWLFKFKALDAPATVAGNIALAKGLLVASKKPKAAIRHFEEALLLAPGTLIAESALRQLISIPEIVSHATRLRYIGSRYLMRYRASVFATAFRRAYAAAFVELKSRSKTDNKWLLDLLKSQPAQVRSDYAIELARAALVSGKADLVAFAIKIIEPSKVASAADKARYTFYTRAAAIIQGAAGAPSGAIDKIDSAVLSERDAELLRASKYLVKAIRERPSLDTLQASDKHNKPAQPTDQKAPQREVINQGRRVIASIDKMLGQ